jgi:outer membrane receptor for ferrienterochelin and colicins
MKLKLFCLTAVLPSMFHTQTASYDSLSVNTLIRDTITEKVSSSIDEVVISGTMKAVKRLESPIPVEVYSPAFFRKNPTPNIFDALQNVNGVRPQLNCNICSTGDIHINGLEGPYTMVLIDGMPMVSSLGTVYGLTGIPNSLVERIEIVKGPASSLYGSEAVGGIINIITKKAGNAPAFSADVMSTTWAENNIDLGFQIKARPGTTLLTGINYYIYKEVSDMNSDRFTDVPLQKRISVFQKWNFRRPENKLFSMAARYMYEDRWGGDVRWNRSYRGGNEIYGESIYTQRAELFGAYQLPVRESMNLAFSFVNHDQDSRYGTLSYIANQKVVFGQLTWDRRLGKHDLLTGAAVRYTYYDDNTPATVNHSNNNQPEKVLLPGIFVQDEIKLNDKHSVLGGLRFDYNQSHGSIFTPRFAYKWAPNDENILRFNAGTGFRVVNLFTEDHAALTGSRDILILTGLKPEKSYNANLNFTKKFYSESGTFLGMEATAFYTYFTNRIVPDYETDANKIIYDNLDGHAVSRGLSLNADLNHHSGVKFILGATLMENTLSEFGMRSHQLLTENFTGTWALSYKIRSASLTLDYTGNVYSPMRLPLLGDLDPRKPTSPWWSIQNIQLSYDGLKNWEIYGVVKNLLNWTPNRGNPFLIARSHDPFDQNVVFDPSGQAVATPENPYALTFDPTYVYAPNQGIRGFLGIRFKLD